jgi:hypothetical protein
VELTGSSRTLQSRRVGLASCAAAVLGSGLVSKQSLLSSGMGSRGRCTRQRPLRIRPKSNHNYRLPQSSRTRPQLTPVPHLSIFAQPSSSAWAFGQQGRHRSAPAVVAGQTLASGQECAASAGLPARPSTPPGASLAHV